MFFGVCLFEPVIDRCLVHNAYGSRKWIRVLPQVVRLWSDQRFSDLLAARLNYWQNNAFMTGFVRPLTWAYIIVVPWNKCFQWKWFQCKIQLQTVDHSVRWSMKNAASCVKRCEMQDTPSTWFSNAYCSLGSFPGLRLSEGLYEIKLIVKVCVEYTDILMLYSRQTYAITRHTKHTTDVLTLMHVIVQFIGDNGRTPHVLLAIVSFERCLSRHAINQSVVLCLRVTPLKMVVAR